MPTLRIYLSSGSGGAARALLFVAALLQPLACAQQQPPAAAAMPQHHRGDQFQNNHTEFEPRGLWAVVRWRLESMKAGLPKPPLTPTPVVKPDLAFIHANARAGDRMEPALTWIGHASVLAQFGGINMLTDPIFSERASPWSTLGPRRAQPPGLALHELPHIDLVVISHNHYDHLDGASVVALAAQPGGSPLFVVPLGNKAWLTEIGIDHVVELDWWQSHRLPGGAEVVLTPVQHWSGRGIYDRMKSLWGGFAVLTPQFHLFHAGDTGYSRDFADIRTHFAARQSVAAGGGFDVALLPIGAYEPRWFMQAQHIDPAEAVQAHQDLGAKTSMGMHWGTFELTDESLDEPPRALTQQRRLAGIAEDRFFVMAIGETRRLPRR